VPVKIGRRQFPGSIEPGHLFADEIAADGGEVLPELLFQMPKNW
jgi:hypothetical protein